MDKRHVDDIMVDEIEDLDELNTNKPKPTDEVLQIPRTTFNYFVIGLTFLAVGVFLGANALGAASIDSAELEAVVRDAISDIDLNAERPEERFELVDDDPYLGDENAPVVIVEFSDFQCQFCGRHFQQTFEPLLENYGEHIRYVYRDFVQPIGPESFSAALAAQCANDQDKFWEFHNALFENQQLLNRDFYVDLAIEQDMDVDAFVACFDEQIYSNEIVIDLVDGQLQGMSGTPGFFVNGQFLRGALPYEVFEQVIVRELNKAGIEVDVVPSVPNSYQSLTGDTESVENVNEVPTTNEGAEPESNDDTAPHDDGGM